MSDRAVFFDRDGVLVELVWDAADGAFEAPNLGEDVYLVPEAADAGAGAGTEGDAALDGGPHEAGQDRRDLGERVERRRVVRGLELTAGEEPPDLGADRGEKGAA